MKTPSSDNILQTRHIEEDKSSSLDAGHLVLNTIAWACWNLYVTMPHHRKCVIPALELNASHEAYSFVYMRLNIRIRFVLYKTQIRNIFLPVSKSAISHHIHTSFIFMITGSIFHYSLRTVKDNVKIVNLQKHLNQATNNPYNRPPLPYPELRTKRHLQYETWHARSNHSDGEKEQAYI